MMAWYVTVTYLLSSFPEFSHHPTHRINAVEAMGLSSDEPEDDAEKVVADSSPSFSVSSASDDRQRRRSEPKSRQRKERKRSKKRRKHRRRSEYSSADDSDSFSESSAERRRRRRRKKKRRKRERAEKVRGGDDQHKSRLSTGSKRHGHKEKETASNEVPTKHSENAAQPAPAASAGVQPTSTPTPPPKVQKAPMTREQYEALRNTVREVYDAETGRYRMVRGTGEIVERMVSRQEHQFINQQATHGDGQAFARHVFQRTQK